MPILFASDIHLSPQRPDISKAFIEFLTTEGAAAQRLYLLGDIFEYWLGDDVSLADYPTECAALKMLTDNGTEVFAQVGNRDFALGRGFSEATGVVLLPDPSIITINQQSVIIGHGDDLCTDDVSYQRLRRVMRNPVVLGFMRRWPAALRRRFAQNLKTKSSQAQASKAPMIMDVNPQAVEQRFKASGCKVMIHGHTHRPMHHLHNKHHRIVLGDWYTQGSYLKITKEQLQPDTWQLSQLDF